MCCQSGLAERAMQRRPAVLALPAGGPEPSPQPEVMASPPPFAGRNSEPEIFTFDLQAVPAAPPAQPPRRPISRRPRRVLYPSQARRNRFVPPEERSPARRWLYALCLLVFVQVCLEEEDAVALKAPGLAAPSPTLEESAPLMRDQLHAPALHPGMQAAAQLPPGNLTCQLLRGLIITL